MSATTTSLDPMALLAGMAQQTEKNKGKSAEKPAVNDASLDGSVGQWMEADKEVKKWKGNVAAVAWNDTPIRRDCVRSPSLIFPPER